MSFSIFYDTFDKDLLLHKLVFGDKTLDVSFVFFEQILYSLFVDCYIALEKSNLSVKRMKCCLEELLVFVEIGRQPLTLEINVQIAFIQTFPSIYPTQELILKEEVHFVRLTHNRVFKHASEFLKLLIVRVHSYKIGGFLTTIELRLHA